MRKNILKGLILSTASVLALGVVTFAPTTASASSSNELTVTLANNTIAIGTQEAESVTFAVNGANKTIAYDMQDGASVRLSAPTGIRFTSFISKADYEGLQTEYGKDNVEIGTIIVEADNYNEETFEVGGANVGKLKADKISLYDEDNGILRFCAAINTLPENVYDTILYAKSYVSVTVEGTTYYGYTDFDAENQRSIDEVATKALFDTQRTWTDGERYLLEDFAADMQTGKVTVDTSSETWLTAFGESATKAYEADETAKTVSQVTKDDLDAFDSTAKGNETARTKTYTVYTNNDVYKTEVLLASVIIDTKEELLNWQYYTVKGEVHEETTKNMTVTYIDTSWHTVTQKYDRTHKAWAYDGYVVLGANVDLTFAYGTNAKGNVTSSFIKVDDSGTAVDSDIVATEEFCVKDQSALLNCPEYGFMGTFDGRGYTISGGVYGAGGLFGGVGGTGVVKNLAIKDAALFVGTYAESGLGSDGTFNTNANVKWSGNAIIGQTFCGTMDNCLIEVKYNPLMYVPANSSYKKVDISGVTTVDGETTTTTITALYNRSAASTVFFSMYGTLQNVVVYNPKAATNIQRCILVGSAVNEEIARFDNVYVYTNYAEPTSQAADVTSSSTNWQMDGITRGRGSDAITQDIIDSLDPSLWNITLNGTAVDNGFNLKPMV